MYLCASGRLRLDLTGSRSAVTSAWFSLSKSPSRRGREISYRRSVSQQFAAVHEAAFGPQRRLPRRCGQVDIGGIPEDVADGPPNRRL